MLDRPVNKQAGFSLIELMVVVALMVILMTVGVPGFQQVIAQNRAATNANDLLYHLQLARSEAVRHASTVSICPVTQAAPETCTADVDWSEGWILFIDTAGDGAFDSATDTLLRTAPGLSGTVGLEGPQFMRYQPAGNGTIASFELNTGSEQRWVCVELSGRSTVQKGVCS